jgi:hypothetical protein
MKYRAVLAAMACLLVACDHRVPTEPMRVPEPSFQSGTGASLYGVGGGSVNFADGRKFAKFAFSAHTGPQGDFGSSRFTIEDPSSPLDVHVDVDCVNVIPLWVGAGGWFGGVVTKVTPEPNVFRIEPGDRALFGINDFGEPSDPTADEYQALIGVVGTSPTTCKVLEPSPHSSIDQGNINIKIGGGGLTW